MCLLLLFLLFLTDLVIYTRPHERCTSKAISLRFLIYLVYSFKSSFLLCCLRVGISPYYEKQDKPKAKVDLDRACKGLGLMIGNQGNEASFEISACCRPSFCAENWSALKIREDKVRSIRQTKPSGNQKCVPSR